MKNVSIGQYYAADSPIHRLDARTKVILAVLYIVISFLCQNIISFGLLLASGIFVIALARIPFRVVLRALKPIIVIMIITVIINLFATKGETLLVEWQFIRIYLEGVYNAVFMAIRIMILIVGVSVFLTYTTTPISLTDAIERLLFFLKKIKVPVHEFAMMMTIALRFIPTIVEETEKIMSAQKARGADFSSGGIVARAKALIPVLIPLIVSAIRHAGELAIAMECRCYNGDSTRTRMTVRKMHFSDFVAFVIMLLFGAALVYFNVLNIGYTL
jgi:energy-coupling factor transport system permease protein